MKSIILFFVLLFVLPTMYAIDCRQVTNRQWCRDIQQSDLSEAEKAYLLSDILSNTKYYPDHELVRQWNARIPVDVPPERVPKQNQGTIRTAWVKILTVMPSVLLNNTLHIDQRGEVLTGFKHDVRLPRGTASGDCRTSYRLLSDTGTLKLSLNNVLQGTGHRVRFTTLLPHNTNVWIRADYEVMARFAVDHYRWKRVGEGELVRVFCNYENTEIRTDRLTVHDQLPVKIYRPNPQAAFQITDKHEGSTTGLFTFKDTVNTELLFDNASFKQHNDVFSEVYSLKPLNVLTVKAEELLNQEQRNLTYGNGKITVQNTPGCRIALYTFFHRKNVLCNLEFERPIFTVSTDKITYNPSELIQLGIEPTGRQYKVEYAGQTYQTEGNLGLHAVHSYNRITVTYQDRTVPHYIHVKNEKPLAFAFLLTLFGTVNYAFVEFLRWKGGVFDV